MKLLSVNLELRAIKSLASSDERIRSRLLAALKPDFFYYDPAKEAYNRIVGLVRNRGIFPDLPDLVSDPVLSEETRKIISSSKQKILTNKTQLVSMLESLDKYRKLRGLYHNAEQTIRDLQQPSVNLDKLIERNSDALMEVRTSVNSKEQLTHFGVGGNAAELVKKVLSGTRTEVIPTGFSVWDDRNGGFFPGSLVTLAATTGGGKCVVYNTYVWLAESIKLIRNTYTLESQDGQSRLYFTLWRHEPLSENTDGIIWPRDFANEIEIGDLTYDTNNDAYYTVQAIEKAVINTRYVPIGELYESLCTGTYDMWLAPTQPLFVYSHLGVKPAQGIFKTRGKTVKIEFCSSCVPVEGLPEHKLWVERDNTNEFVCLADIKVGDKLPMYSPTGKVLDSVQVRAVSHTETEKDVYDLSVDDAHSYMIDDGIISHNSAMALQMLINMAERGYDTVLVPLEMTREETVARLLANLANVEVTKFLSGNLPENERLKTKQAIKDWVAKLRELKTRWSIYEPEADVTIEDVLFTLKPYGYKVILVDYISLLKGVDGEDSWRQLGIVARFAKIFAKVHKIVVILLAQATNDGLIRYSRAIQEHCLTGGALIETERGLVSIDSLDIGDKVLAGTEYKPVTDIKVTPNKPVFRLTSEWGFDIEATGNHRFKTKAPGSDTPIVWKTLKDISEGDYVAIYPGKFTRKPKAKPDDYYPPITYPHRVEENVYYSWHNAVLPEFMTPDLAYFLGVLNLGGHLGGSQNSLTLTRKQAETDLLIRWQELGNKLYRENNDDDSPLPFILIENHGSFHDMTRVLCSSRPIKAAIHWLNGNKCVPDRVLNAPIEVGTAYLRGIFDYNGTVRGNGLSLRAGGDINSQRIQIMLQRLGVPTKRRLLIAKGSRENSTWEVFVPNIYLEKLLKVLALNPSDNRRRIEHQLKLMPATSKAENREYALGYIWDRVVNIEPLGRETVYDLTVADNHEFIANGISVHNSNNCWAWVYTEEAREFGFLHIQQLKARNQEAFSFDLGHDFSTMRIFDADKEVDINPDCALGKSRAKFAAMVGQGLPDISIGEGLDDEDGADDGYFDDEE